MLLGIMPTSSSHIEEMDICDRACIKASHSDCADFLFVSLFEGFLESMISVGKSVKGVPLVTVLLNLALVSLPSFYL